MLQPAGHRVLLKRDKLETKTDWGFEMVVGSDQKKLERAAIDTGVIVRIGPNAWKGWDDGTPWAAVGQEVYFARHAGKTIVDESTEEEYLIINDEDVIAIKGNQND